MELIYKFTPEEKTLWWGDGEWVNEPDFIKFTCEGFECQIIRLAVQEPNAPETFKFGGHLNGYVKIPEDHPYFNKDYSEIDIDCHRGLTFGEISALGEFWIGFDCAHSSDIIPSHEHIMNTREWGREITQQLKEFKEKFNIKNSSLFDKTYRNIDFCIEECKSIVEQLRKKSERKDEV